MKRDLFKEAYEGNYFIRDASGKPQIEKSLSIEFGTVDLTNPEAWNWYKKVIQEEVIGKGQSAGWMCDFGEYVRFDSHFESGVDAAVYHNKYPEDWAKLNYQAVEEMGLLHDTLFFMRSAWITSP